MRAIVHAMKENKSLDTKKAADYLQTLKDYPGITGPISFSPDGNRIGSGYMAYEIQKDGSYKIVYNK